MNIERPTSNIEWKNMKKQSLKPEQLNDILEETEELIKIFVTSIRTAEKNHALAWLDVRYWMFVFNSMLDVRCSMFDVYLSKQPRMALMQPVNVYKIT